MKTITLTDEEANFLEGMLSAYARIFPEGKCDNIRRKLLEGEEVALNREEFTKLSEEAKAYDEQHELPGQ